MNIGDRIPALRPTIGEKSEYNKARPATVVYVHPEQRYYVAEFDIPGYKFRESYPIKGEITDFSKK